MICSKCEKDLDVVAQLKEANELYYDGVSGPIMLMIRCNTCDEQTAMIEIIPLSGETVDIESPVGTVKFPKI